MFKQEGNLKEGGDQEVFNRDDNEEDMEEIVKLNESE